MNRVLSSCCLTAAIVVPWPVLAQTQPAAAKPAAQEKSDRPEATKAEHKPAPADAAASVVKSAAFSDYDNDGEPDLVIGYELLATDELLVQQAQADVAGAYLEVVTRVDDTGIGASLSPVGETLQAQLKLAKGQGLVVTHVKDGSPAAKAGLQVDDILLSAGDRPLAKPSDVADVVSSPVKKPFTVEFTVLRAGERRSVPLTVAEETAGRYLATLALRLTEPSYRVGVEVSDAGSTLRAQLKLPKDQGIVIDRVLPESPAQKTGFQAHDVLTTVDGKPLTKSEDLSAAVKASEGKPLKFALLRGGQRIDLTVTPEKRDEQAYRRTRLTQERVVNSLSLVLGEERKRARILSDMVVRAHAPKGDTAVQIERMLKQIDDLRDSLKALQSSVANGPKAPPKASPAKTDLPKSEPPRK